MRLSKASCKTMTSKAFLWNGIALAGVTSGQDQVSPGDAPGPSPRKRKRGAASSLKNQTPQSFDMDGGDGSKSSSTSKRFANGRFCQAQGSGFQDGQFQGYSLDGRRGC